MPSTISTTRISTSVKPRRRSGRCVGAARTGCGLLATVLNAGLARARVRDLALLPGADVGVDTFASGLAVRAERQHVDLAVQARVRIDVRIAPRILRQPLDVAAALPVRR